MVKKDSIFATATLLLVALAVSASFYRAFVLQDFNMTGFYLEFPTPESTHVWFIHNKTEHTLDVESTEREDILEAIRSDLTAKGRDLTPELVTQFDEAYSEHISNQ